MEEITDGGWRMINMELYLDDSFKPLNIIEEDIQGKYMALYELSR